MSDPKDQLLSIGITSLTLIVGPWIGYRLGLRSERLKNDRINAESRDKALIDFAAYIKRWKKECERPTREYGFPNRDRTRRSELAFSTNLPRFIERAERLKPLLNQANRPEFDTITDYISQRNHMGNQEQYQELMEKLNRVIEIATTKN